MNSMLDGATFAYLRDSYILRRLRTGTVTIEFRIPAPEQEPAAASEPVITTALIPEQKSEPTAAPVVEPPAAATGKDAAAEYITVYPVTLRTNLLLDIVGGANLGIEGDWVPSLGRADMTGNYKFTVKFDPAKWRLLASRQPYDLANPDNLHLEGVDGVSSATTLKPVNLDPEGDDEEHKLGADKRNKNHPSDYIRSKGSIILEKIVYPNP